MVKLNGGDGFSKETAVIILYAKNEIEGVDSEYDYIKEHFGEEGISWNFKHQELIDEGDKQYDILNIIFPNGEIKKVWFDITDFYGK